MHLRLNIAFSQTFLKVSPSCGVVSILPRVDLTENTEMDWFCALPLFQLDTLSLTSSDLFGIDLGRHAYRQEP